MAKLTARQEAMIKASEPSDRDPKDGAGVELLSGSDYAVARALERKELGVVEGPGGPLSGMYFNNASGLEVRAILLGGGHCGGCGAVVMELEDGLCSECW